jgi:type 1 fimbria pilin
LSLLLPLAANAAPLPSVTIEIDGQKKLVADNCSIDIHAGTAGLFYMPIYCGPLRSKTLDLRVEGGSIKLDRLRVHRLESIWKQHNQ